jgi:hypothetical protein
VVLKDVINNATDRLGKEVTVLNVIYYSETFLKEVKQIRKTKVMMHSLMSDKMKPKSQSYQRSMKTRFLSVFPSTATDFTQDVY